MHALSTSSSVSLVHRCFARSRHCTRVRCHIQLQVLHSSQVKCRRAGFSHLSRPVHRRQVLQTASSGFLTSWLPFSQMTAKAQFHPEQKWWRSDTVAVVTGGVHYLMTEHTSFPARCQCVRAHYARQFAITQCHANNTFFCSQQGYWLWYCKTSGRARPDHCCCCKEWLACSGCLL